MKSTKKYHNAKNNAAKRQKIPTTKQQHSLLLKSIRGGGEPNTWPMPPVISDKKKANKTIGNCLKCIKCVKVLKNKIKKLTG
jgi:hypothetical protein